MSHYHLWGVLYTMLQCLEYTMLFSATASTYTVNRDRVSPEFIGSRNCVPMVLTAESPLTQGQ